jgi:hypothetical protein
VEGGLGLVDDVDCWRYQNQVEISLNIKHSFIKDVFLIGIDD